MAKRQSHRRPVTGRGRIGALRIAMVAALAVLAVGALVWLGGRGEPGGQAVAVPSEGNVKGLQSAPVEVEDWSDFQ